MSNPKKEALNPKEYNAAINKKLKEKGKRRKERSERKSTWPVISRHPPGTGSAC